MEALETEVQALFERVMDNSNYQGLHAVGNAELASLTDSLLGSRQLVLHVAGAVATLGYGCNSLLPPHAGTSGPSHEGKSALYAHPVPSPPGDAKPEGRVLFVVRVRVTT